MSRFRFSRRALAGVCLGLAAVCVSLPALADKPVAVTCAANSVWAQEIGNLTHSDSSREYTVAVAAGKTLQLNLFSRNPNVRFKVEDQTRDNLLLDTAKTGESSWTLPNAPAATETSFAETGVIVLRNTTHQPCRWNRLRQTSTPSPSTPNRFSTHRPIVS